MRPPDDDTRVTLKVPLTITAVYCADAGRFVLDEVELELPSGKRISFFGVPPQSILQAHLEERAQQEWLDNIEAGVLATQEKG